MGAPGLDIGMHEGLSLLAYRLRRPGLVQQLQQFGRALRDAANGAQDGFRNIGEIEIEGRGRGVGHPRNVRNGQLAQRLCPQQIACGFDQPPTCLQALGAHGLAALVPAGGVETAGRLSGQCNFLRL